jgi:hypothetical protein
MTASTDQETKMLKIISPASSRMIASTNLKNQLPLPSLTPNNALRRNAPTNGLPAKRTPNASPLFRTAKRSVEPVNHAGLSASHPRAAKQQSIPLSALMPINALVLFQDSRPAFINHANPTTTHAFLT